MITINALSNSRAAVHVDLCVLAAAIYFVLHWSQEARALRVTFGILALEAGAIVSGRVGLPVTSWVLHASAIIAALILIVLFQPELRHALSRLEVTLRWPRQRAVLMGALEAIAKATFSLASARRGALIVIGRRDSVGELVRGGVPLGGQVSPEILEAIFRKVSPVHDGATLIEADHIIRVGAILPLAQREDLPARWGTRHRAGMGLAERCDALVIVASEERGDVTLMYDATFERMPTADALLAALRTLMPAPARSYRQPFFNRRELGLQAMAAVIALAIWSSALYTETAVRMRTVPIEFTNLGSGLRITEQSAAVVEVRLRGASWLLDSAGASPVVIRVSLAGLGEGLHAVAVSPTLLRLPIGVSADTVAPEQVRVRLRGATPTERPEGGEREAK